MASKADSKVPVKKVNKGEDLDSVSEHHRQLKCHKGRRTKTNLSYVTVRDHRAWHTLYKDYKPEQIIAQFAEDYEVYGVGSYKSPLMKKLHEGWVNATDSRIKRTQAWQTLFAGKSLEEIVRAINHVWLDPAYEIIIGVRRVKTVELKPVVYKKPQGYR